MTPRTSWSPLTAPSLHNVQSKYHFTPPQPPSRYEPPLQQQQQQHPLQSLSFDSATTSTTLRLGNLHALGAVVAWMGPLALQLFNSSAYMQWVVPGHVTVGKATIDLVTTAIRNELKVAHIISPILSEFCFSLGFLASEKSNFIKATITWLRWAFLAFSTARCQVKFFTTGY